MGNQSIQGQGQQTANPFANGSQPPTRSGPLSQSQDTQIDNLFRRDLVAEDFEMSQGEAPRRRVSMPPRRPLNAEPRGLRDEFE